MLGAGFADCAVAEWPTSRGWRTTLIDENEGLARGMPAHRTAVMHPHVSVDNSILSQLSRTGNLLARCHWDALDRAGFAVGLQCIGVLQLAEHAGDVIEQQCVVQTFGYPVDYTGWFNAEQAAKCIGASVSQGGWRFAQTGRVAPPDICRTNLAAVGAAVGTHWNMRVEPLRQNGDQRAVLDTHQNVIAGAPVIVLANNPGATRLAPLISASLKPVHGQLTDVPVAALQAGAVWSKTVVCGEEYLSPTEQGVQSVRIGSSFQPDTSDLTECVADHTANLRRLTALRPGQAGTLGRPDPVQLRGYVSVRYVSANRLPSIGPSTNEATAAVPDFCLRGLHTQLPCLVRLYATLAHGSRGLTRPILGAELLVAQIGGGPLPLESDLVVALDPGRLVLRALQHGGLQGQGAVCAGSKAAEPLD